MPVSVAVINYNTRDHLRACLASVVPEHPAEVIVVDNASTDGSAEMVPCEFPDVTLIAREDNPGYGAAANRAIAASSGDVVLLLNSDTRILPGALTDIVDYAERNPAAAIVGPRLLNQDGSFQRSCFPWPGAGAALFEEIVGSSRITGIPVLRERFWRTWSHDRPRKVPWVLGAALAIRREAFEAVGGFDPSFFMYFEETDLCKRLWQAGWEVHFSPEAEIVHVGGASTTQQRATMYAQLYVSMLRFVEKHDGAAARQRLAFVLKTVMRLRMMRESARLKLSGEAGHARSTEVLAGWRAVIDEL
jgi:GT2 family glycosyltransferase